MSEANDRDILSFAERIGQKIAKLEKLKQQLLAAVEAPEEGPKIKDTARKKQRQAASLIGKPNGGVTSSRKQEAADFILKNGPSTRQEIKKGTGIPKGTLGFVLKDEALFRNDGHGKWEILFRKAETTEADEIAEATTA